MMACLFALSLVVIENSSAPNVDSVPEVHDHFKPGDRHKKLFVRADAEPTVLRRFGVAVPAAVLDLNETDARLDQPPGQEHRLAERGLSIGFPDRFWLLRHLEGLEVARGENFPRPLVGPLARLDAGVRVLLVPVLLEAAQGLPAAVKRSPGGGLSSRKEV